MAVPGGSRGLVFTTTIGTPVDERNVRRVFKAVLTRAELPAIRIHDLGHTTATLLLTQGVHPRVVMETLGHSQISLTLDTYSHVLPGLQAEAASRMQEALGENGCQNGCQTETSASPDEQELQKFSGKVVSREGIEPSTRRLRVVRDLPDLRRNRRTLIFDAADGGISRQIDATQTQPGPCAGARCQAPRLPLMS